MRNYKGYDIPNINDINDMINNNGGIMPPCISIHSMHSTLELPISMEDLANIKTNDVDQFIYDHAVNTIDTYLSSL